MALYSRYTRALSFENLYQSTGSKSSAADKVWSREVHKEIINPEGYGVGYTIEFWVNIDSRTKIPDTNEVVVRVCSFACAVFAFAFAFSLPLIFFPCAQ